MPAISAFDEESVPNKGRESRGHVCPPTGQLRKVSTF
jgi:hypothetical protein